MFYNIKKHGRSVQKTKGDKVDTIKRGGMFAEVAKMRQEKKDEVTQKSDLNKGRVSEIRQEKKEPVELPAERAARR